MSRHTRGMLWLARVAAVALAIASLGCGNDGENLEPATVNLTGAWSISETVSTATGVCAGDIGEQRSYTLNAVQDGNSLTVTVGSGAIQGTVFRGTVSGNKINWSGSFPDQGGTTKVTRTDLTATDTSLSGSATWEWSGEGEQCSGTTQVTGTKGGSA